VEVIGQNEVARFYGSQCMYNHLVMLSSRCDTVCFTVCVLQYWKFCLGTKFETESCHYCRKL